MLKVGTLAAAETGITTRRGALGTPVEISEHGNEEYDFVGGELVHLGKRIRDWRVAKIFNVESAGVAIERGAYHRRHFMVDLRGACDNSNPTGSRPQLQRNVNRLSSFAADRNSGGSRSESTAHQVLHGNTLKDDCRTWSEFIPVTVCKFECGRFGRRDDIDLHALVLLAQNYHHFRLELLARIAQYVERLHAELRSLPELGANLVARCLVEKHERGQVRICRLQGEDLVARGLRVIGQHGRAG